MHTYDEFGLHWVYISLFVISRVRVNETVLVGEGRGRGGLGRVGTLYLFQMLIFFYKEFDVQQGMLQYVHICMSFV